MEDTEKERRRGCAFLLVLTGFLVWATLKDPAVPANGWLAAAYRCHGGAVVMLVLMGLTYALRKKFMPYHAIALGKEWEELDVPQQTIFLGSLRIIGNAWLAVSLALGLLLHFGFSAGLKWAIYGVPAIGLLACVPTLRAVLLVRATTPASPPRGAALIPIALFLAGLVCSLVPEFAG